MKNSLQTIFLQIGGTPLEIRFGKYKNGYFHSLFMKEWRRIFNKYIVHASPLSSQNVINVVEDAGLYFHEEDKKITLTIAHISKRKITTFYHLGIKQFCRIVAQLVFKELIKNNGLYLHGSAIQTSHGAVIFLGKSGAGKSTISILLSHKYPVLADDQLFIMCKSNRYYFYQSFIPESNPHIGPSTKMIPIWRVFFIKQSKLLSIEHISSKTKIYKWISPELFTTFKDATKSNKNLIRFIKNEDLFFTYAFPKNQKMLTSSFQELTR